MTGGVSHTGGAAGFHASLADVLWRLPLSSAPLPIKAINLRQSNGSSDGRRGDITGIVRPGERRLDPGETITALLCHEHR